MKIMFLSLFFFSQFSVLAYSRSESTPNMQICRDVEMSLAYDFLIPEKPLPDSFEEMPFIRECVDRIWSNPEYQISILNNLAIVPDAPEIKPQDGVRGEFMNHQLFAISREFNYDYAAKDTDQSDPLNGGRFAIVISRDGKSASPSWIPESEARMILKQMKDFDPKTQPLAFEKGVVEKAEKSKHENSQPLDSYREHPQTPATDKAPTGSAPKAPLNISPILWLFLMFSLLVCVGFGVKHLRS